MTHQEYETRLDAILDAIKPATQLGTKQAYADWAWGKQAIDRLFLDAVGEDDAYGEFCSECGDWDDGRNDLRQQIRTTITGKEGGE